MADGSGSIPLHIASEKPSLMVLKYLIERYPEGICRDDNNGLLPLHRAFTGWLSDDDLDRIRILVEADPFTILSKSHNGRTPLQRAFLTRAPHNIKTFLEARQAEAIQAIREAFDETMDELPLPDVVVAEIWKFAKPNVRTPSEEGWLDDSEDDSDDDNSDDNYVDDYEDFFEDYFDDGDDYEDDPDDLDDY